MGRKRSGDAVGTLLIAIIALGAWIISEYGVMLLIFGALALVAWVAHSLTVPSGNSRSPEFETSTLR